MAARDGSHRRIRVHRDSVQSACGKQHSGLACAAAGVNRMRAVAHQADHVIDQLGWVRRTGSIVELGVLAKYQTLLTRHEPRTILDVAAMQIGSSGRFESRLSPDECGQRLKRHVRLFGLRGWADASGFSLMKWRSAIRIRGTFTRAGQNLTLVDYQVGPGRAAMVALAVSTVIGLGLLALGFTLAQASIVEVWPLILIVALVIGANLWIAELQAQSLASLVRSELAG